MKIYSRGRFAATALIVLIFSSVSFSAIIPQIGLGWNGDSWQSSYSASDINQGYWGQLNVSSSVNNESIFAAAELQFAPDMFVLVNFTVSNISNTVQTIDLSFTVPTTETISPGVKYGGSTGGSITDNGGNASLAQVTTADDQSFYSGTIDGAQVLSIYDAPFSWGAFYNGQTLNINSQNPGLGVSGPSIAGGPALSSIGIDHHFTLTPGDVIAVTSYFQVTPSLVIPEPATLAILSIGSLVLLRRRKR